MDTKSATDETIRNDSNETRRDRAESPEATHFARAAIDGTATKVTANLAMFRIELGLLFVLMVGMLSVQYMLMRRLTIVPGDVLMELRTSVKIMSTEHNEILKQLLKAQEISNVNRGLIEANTTTNPPPGK